ncbi:MAG TPA: hypothetical protein VGF99_19895 [Myxococcota bacterium]
MVAPAPSPKARTLQQVLLDATPDRKLLIVGPGNEKMQDSRFSVAEVGADFVSVKLLGDEHLLIPFSSIVTVKAERTQVTIRIRG